MTPAQGSSLLNTHFLFNFLAHTLVLFLYDVEGGRKVSAKEEGI